MEIHARGCNYKKSRSNHQIQVRGLLCILFAMSLFLNNTTQCYQSYPPNHISYDQLSRLTQQCAESMFDPEPSACWLISIESKAIIHIAWHGAKWYQSLCKCANSNNLLTHIMLVGWPASWVRMWMRGGCIVWGGSLVVSAASQFGSDKWYLCYEIRLCIVMMSKCGDSKSDTVAEWLRRLTRNQLGLSRAGSSPVSVAYFFYFLLSSMDALHTERGEGDLARQRDQIYYDTMPHRYLCDIAAPTSVIVVLYQENLRRVQPSESMSSQHWLADNHGGTLSRPGFSSQFHHWK